MVDVSHEPRWGRISEAAGEDPYLNSVMAAARVKGAQGNDYGAPDKVVTSVKHFAAYGQPEARPRLQHDRHVASSGCGTSTCRRSRPRSTPARTPSMCSFNAINGVPGCANKYTETNILKQRWGFDGFIESDYTAVAELRACPPVNPDERPLRPRHRRGRPRGRAQGAQRRHRLRDGLAPTTATSASSCRRAARSRCSASTTRCAASCA